MRADCVSAVPQADEARSGGPEVGDRDRFVLSNGHASMLLYGSLHLSGYDLPMAQLEQFRQWGSETPGHPEYGDTPGVEVTTGPLGQGFGMAVGMAAAERHLAAVYNRDMYTRWWTTTPLCCAAMAT